MDHELQKSDIILVLCSHDTTVAERGAQLFLDGWAPLLVVHRRPGRDHQAFCGPIRKPTGLPGLRSKWVCRKTAS